MTTNYIITKREGNKVEVFNTKSERTHTGVLFANETKVSLENWGGRGLSKVVTIA